MADKQAIIEDASRTWVEEGIISADQREAILARHPKGEGRKRQAAILSILGAILVGVGAILFVAANWQEMPRLLRVGLLLTAMLGAHAGAWYLREGTGKSPRVGHALYLLGSLLFGATLFLGAQLYNVNANAPWLLLVWLAGVAPMAWGMASRPILTLSISIAGLWLGFQSVTWIQYAREVYEPAAAMVPFFALGILLWGAGRLHRTWDRLSGMVRFDPVLRGFASIALFAGLYVFSFDLPDTTPGEPGYVGQLLVLTGLFLAAGLAMVLWWVSRQEATIPAWSEAGTLVGLSLLMGIAALAPDLVVGPVLFNLVLFGAIIGLVVLGVQRRDELMINLGLLFFVVAVVTRYFDVFFELLDRSLFFIVGGLLLLGGGWFLERQRQDLVEQARGGEA